MTERRLRQEISYDAIVDRRRKTTEQPQRLDWAEPATPGAIRPGVNDGDWDGVERRRVPGAGDE